MDSLSVYCNCGSDSYADLQKSEILQRLKDGVATTSRKPNYHYCNFSAFSYRLHLC